MNLEPMNATDAVNVLKFLERQIESGFGSPESTASLQRVVNHLRSEVERLTSPVDPTYPRTSSFRDQALLAALPLAAMRVPYLQDNESQINHEARFVRDIVNNLLARRK